MLKAVQKCIDSKTDKKVGNHATFWTHPCTGDDIQYFTYHGNVICRVNWTRKKVSLDNAGWNTSSTNRALNDYKRYFSSNGFEVIDRREK